MKRMPEKPLLPEAQDKKETVAFVATLAVAAFFSLTVVGLAYRGDGIIVRILQAGCVFGSAFLANVVKQKMAKEYNEKVRVWLNFWDDYKEETKRLEMDMWKETDECVKETMRMKIANRNDYYNEQFY